MACAICSTRREKRHCPGVQGEICTVCCGTQREETIDCPLTCEYLQIAHQHENPERDPASVPNRDFPVPESFIRENAHLLTLMQRAILKAALERNAIDSDVREALDGLARTYQTLVSGLYYESRPSNPIAAAIFDGAQQRVADIRKLEDERKLHKVQDRQLLTLFVFLRHMEWALNNGRKRGRRFLGYVLGTMAQLAEPTQPASAPLIIS
jgi:hypothetical protein